MQAGLALAVRWLLRYMSTFSEEVTLLPGGWSGGAMVLGKLPVPGRPTILITVGQGPIFACSRCGWGVYGHFFSPLSSLLFSTLSGRRPDKD